MEDSLRGQILLASKRLHDPSFFRSAVLILEHTGEGAMGVVVNHPSSVDVANALVGHFGPNTTEGVIYVGGPVEPTALSMLHDNPIWGDEELTIAPGVFIGSSQEAFEEIVRSQDPEKPQNRFRIYSGYAGWQGGQLEGEISRGDWFSIEASDEFVFHHNPYDVWDELLSKFHKQHRFLPIPTEKVEWN